MQYLRNSGLVLKILELLDPWRIF